MRIGELAGVAGVTTRAVRHYHRIGLLPEPARQSNGYREYSLRDAVELCRVRRLTELGLSLDEVRDVLADDSGRDLAEILVELDADLARQEDLLRTRRARLGRLLRQVTDDGALPAHAPVSDDLAVLFGRMAQAAAARGGPEPASAAKERELLALLDTGLPVTERGPLEAIVAAAEADPSLAGRVYGVYEQLDALVDAAVDDPRVEGTARAIAAAVPVGVVAGLELPGDDELHRRDGFTAALFAEFAPAQVAAVRRAIGLLRVEADGGGADGGSVGASDTRGWADGDAPGSYGRDGDRKGGRLR
ncbi:MerR family transcriptional regulator [Cryptosporangium sp. NPDC048952]|uniref:MerR family transcriptional regulator n=1 Tax=Cryptosporangium sp. NPDC048952 TaxID=3363961 RepID=UPI0037205272